jgi:8-oxo-dGTP pyrophosphatase MutT (NUDIX family)
MKRFSTLRPSKSTGELDKEKDDVKFKDDNLKIVDYDNWSIISEKDCVFCVIYLIDLNKFMIRQEYVPTFKYVDGQDLHLSLIGGQIEMGETPETALIREVEEEAGIVIRQGFSIEFLKPLFVSKGNTSKFYFSIIQLTESDYHEVVIKPKSKAEKLSQTAKIDVKYLKNLNPSDIPTEYMLNVFSKYINM